MEGRLNFLKKTQILGSKVSKINSNFSFYFLNFILFSAIKFLKRSKISAKTFQLRENTTYLAQKLLKLTGFWPF